jgi:hypothetical protein
MIRRKTLSIILTIFFSVGAGCSSNKREGTSEPNGQTIAYPYRIGTGIHDITGPPAEVIVAGMVDFSRKGEGVYRRLRSRAVIIKHVESAKRVVLVNSELGMISRSNDRVDDS